jgi:hypothetical protein
MLDKEPLSFPSRNRFNYNPGVPDRQLWAIGMVVVQWGMTETIIQNQIQLFIGSEAGLIAEYAKVRNFRQTVDFLQRQIEHQSSEPFRTNALELLKRIRNLSSQRDEIIHRLWGGGIQEDSWNNPENYPTTDAALLRQAGDKPKKTKSQDATVNLSWRLTFSGVRKIAIEIATLNRDLFMLFLNPTGEQPVT